MTLSEASLNGVILQAVDHKSLHIDRLIPTILDEVAAYQTRASLLKSKFSKLKTHSAYFDNKLMLLHTTVPAWTASEYIWTFNEVASQLRSTLGLCFGRDEIDDQSGAFRKRYSQKDADRLYLIGSLGYSSLAKIIATHIESHEAFSNSLTHSLATISAIKTKNSDLLPGQNAITLEGQNSDIIRFGISLLSIDLTYLWRQSYYLLKQVSSY